MVCDRFWCFGQHLTARSMSKIQLSLQQVVIEAVSAWGLADLGC